MHALGEFRAGERATRVWEPQVVGETVGGKGRIRDAARRLDGPDRLVRLAIRGRATVAGRAGDPQCMGAWQDLGVGSSERAIDRGSRLARTTRLEVGDALRRVRIDRGLSQVEVGRSVKLSRSQVSRIERAMSPDASVRHLAQLAAVLGLELSVRLYPAGTPIRDRAHLALLERVRLRLGPGLRWRTEVPLPDRHDMRAWDAVVFGGGSGFAVEAETRPRDVQALQRRLALKLRDDPNVRHVLLVLADTRWNRRLLREHGDALRRAFPTDGATALDSLAAGQSPDGDAVVLL